MKQLFFAALLLCGAMGFTACNNGPYDADPKANNKDVPNWLDPKYAQSIGEIKYTMNGQTYAHWGNYVVDNGALWVSGVRDESAAKYFVGLGVMNYKGKGTYTFSKTSDNVGNFYITKNGSTTPDTIYTATIGYVNGSGKVEILAEADNILYGTFELTATLSQPTLDDNKKVVLTNGSFKVRKQ